MKQHPAKVIGIGNIVFDHGFLEDERGIKYIYSRGGGTVCNILANLAVSGIETTYVGYYETGTPYGVIALKELRNLNVNTELAKKRNNKNSQIFFQTNKQEFGRPKENTFSSRCIVCNTKADAREMLGSINYSHFIDSVEWKKTDVLVTDKLTMHRFRLVQKAKELNPRLLAVLDLGHIANLRFIQLTTIAKWLKAFDIVFMHDPVFNFIYRQDKKLKKHLYTAKDKNLTAKLLIVTKDHKGLDYYFFTEGKNLIKNSIPPKDVKVVCSAGAGDALISGFISEYITLNLSKDELLSSIKLADKLLLTSVKSTSNVLTKFGARGHLPKPRHLSTPTQKYEEKSLGQIRKLLKKNTPCPFCMRSEISSSFVQHSNLEDIMEAIPNCTDSLESADTAIAKCKEILNSGDSYSVTGTGGSRASASYIAQLINAVTRKPTIFITPYDFYRGLGSKTNWLVVLSYSGNTHDCGLAITKAKEIGVKRVALITNGVKPKLSRLLHNTNQPGGDIIVSYREFCKTAEKSFISFAGVLVPSTLFAISSKIKFNINDLNRWVEKTAKQNSVNDSAELFIKQIIQSKKLEILGGGYAWPAILDLESKLIEGNVCSVQIHESKDFSHGRFMLSMNDPFLSYPKLILQVGKNKYEDLLVRLLSQKSEENRVLRFQSKYEGLMGGLELLIRVQLFTLQIAQRIYKNGIDITKPTLIPKEGLQLYKWKEQSTS